MIDNKKIFSRLWRRARALPLVFISSNSGTGKTTYFKWLFLRRALENNEPLDVFFRWEDDLEQKFSSGSYLTPPTNASKRLLALISKLEIVREDNAYYIRDKESKRKIARALAVNTQSKAKSNENDIGSVRALYDEVLADDGRYCPNECYKFARLIDTRARYRDYQVVCLYNNTSPFFPYEEYYRNSGAVFINFTAGKYSTADKLGGIQQVLAKSSYSEVYLNNSYMYYKVFYKNLDGKGQPTLLYLNIGKQLFKLKEVGEYYLLEPTNKIKKSKECISFSLEDNDYEVVDTGAFLSALEVAFNKRLIFTNKKRYTIYLKQLADFLNLCYTIR